MAGCVQQCRRATNDAVVIVMVSLATTIFCIRLNAFEHLAEFVESHESWQADEFVTAFMIRTPPMTAALPGS